MTRFVIIGGSDAGISAALRARELAPGCEAGERDTGRLLGAQIIGAYGTEVSKRVDIVAAALHQDMRVEDLNDLDLSYTPPLSSPWDPVQMAAQAWVQHWRQSERQPA